MTDTVTIPDTFRCYSAVARDGWILRCQQDLHHRGPCLNTERGRARWTDTTTKETS